MILLAGGTHITGDKDPDEYDEYDDLDSDELSRMNYHLKQHSSIIGRIVVLVVFLFLLTVVIDPMTPGINESEVVYNVGSYPYDKVMGLFREQITDTDNDGLSDKMEIKGWDLESQVLSLKAGDSALYNFSIEYDGFFFINISAYNIGNVELEWELETTENSTTISSSHWTVVTLNTDPLPLDRGHHLLNITVISGNISIDWISMVHPGNEYANALDSDDVIGTTGTITNMLVKITTDPENPDTDFDGMLDGYEAATGFRIGGWQDPHVTNHRFALLIAGGSTIPADNYPSIINNVEYAYEVLHDFYGYKDKNIKVLSWDGKIQTMNIVDAAGTLEEIDNTFTELSTEMGPNDFLYIYLTSHGIPGEIEVYKTPSKHDMFKYEDLMENITFLRNSCGVSRMSLVIDACNSGSILFDVQDDMMVTIASTEATDPSYTSQGGHALFTHYFYEALEHPNLASLPSYEKVTNVDFTFEEHQFISLGEAYTIAKDKLRLQELSQRKQIPQLDQNGDGVADDDDDGMAFNTYI